MLKLVVGCFFALVAISGALIYADSRDDVDRVKRDFDGQRSRHETSKSRLDTYLEGSVKLRSFDKDQLAELVTQICKMDIFGASGGVIGDIHTRGANATSLSRSARSCRTVRSTATRLHVVIVDV